MSFIVVGVDESAGAMAALRWAAKEARVLGVGVMVLHSYDRPLAYWGRDPDAVPEEHVHEHARQVLDDVLAAAAEDLAGLDVHAGVEPGRAAPRLLHAATEADLLVVGTRGGGGFPGLQLGSTAEHCVRHARGVVVVVPSTTPSTVTGQIVVGVDGSSQAEVALTWGVREASRRAAAVDVVSVYEPYRAHGPYGAEFFDVASPGWRHRMTDAASACANQAIEALPHPVSVALKVTVEAGHPAQVLIARSRDADLLVVGARGRQGFEGLLLGSVTRQVLHHAACPVAVVRTEHGEGRGR